MVSRSIVKADKSLIEVIQRISHATIEKIYPRYYPRGAVDFFLTHHCTERIISDIDAGHVFVLVEGNEPVGTVTLAANEINRLFVLPECQGRGHGRALLDFSEDCLFSKHDIISLSASLPSKQIYLKRGFKEVSSHLIETDNGDFLFYDVMEKRK